MSSFVHEELNTSDAFEVVLYREDHAAQDDDEEEIAPAAPGTRRKLGVQEEKEEERPRSRGGRGGAGAGRKFLFSSSSSKQSSSGAASPSSLERVILNFQNIRFVAGKGRWKKNDEEKLIIQDVGATIRNGHVLALMGPSGAGKSTVINVLTQNAFYGKAYGSVTLNGIPMSDRIFKKYCYLVKQHDTNWHYLTAREALTYAAQLYHVSSKPYTAAGEEGMDEEKQEEDDNRVADGSLTNKNKNRVEMAVDHIIQKMGLESCADTRCARLSGGQQRRLSLAMALLKQPAVLFLDEPTSGLDAASATAIMHEITRVARQERLVILCTIHQPSTKVYNDFDQVMILSKGRIAYVGEAHAASMYFDSIGHTLPPNTNPAEHFLDIVNADFSSNDDVDRILDEWSLRNNSQIKKSSSSSNHVGDDNLDTEVLDLSGGGLDDYMYHNLWEETQIMLHRHVTLMKRDAVMYVGRIVLFLVVNCVFGVVYIAARNYTQDQALNKLWVNGWYIGVPSNMAVVAVYKLNLELKSIFVENKNGMGSTISYIIAKTILVIPILFFFSIAALGIPGYVIQKFPPESFGKMILLFMVLISMWESSGEAFAALFDEAVLGMLVHTTWWFAALLFSGYLVPLNDMFWPLKIFYYVLPYNYYVRSALYLIFTQSRWEACTDPSTSAVCVNSTKGIDVLANFERVIPLVSVEDTYWGDLFIMFLLGVFWKVVAIIAIIVKSKRVSSIYKGMEEKNHDHNLAAQTKLPNLATEINGSDNGSDAWRSDYGSERLDNRNKSRDDNF